MENTDGDRADSSETLATQGGITFLGRFFSKLLGFLFVAAVTRFVAPDVYGIYTLGLSIVVIFASVAHLSIHRSLDYFLPQFIADGNYSSARGLLVQVALYSIGLSIAAGAMLWATADRIAPIFNEDGLTMLLPAFAFALPLYTINQVLVSFYNSIKKLQYRVITQSLIRPTAKLILVLIVLPLGFGEFGILYAYMLGFLLAIFAGVGLVYRSESWLQNSQFDMVPTRQILSYSAPLAFAGIIYSLVGYVDFFVIGYFKPASDVGVYRVSYFLAANLAIFISSFAPVFKPMIAESKGDREAIQSIYTIATRWTALLTIPAAITLIIAPETYLSILFSASYSASPWIVIILALGYLVNAGVGPEGMMLEGLGHTRLTLLNTTVMISLNFILNVILVPELGIVGAAVGTAVAMSAAVLLGIVEIYLVRGIFPFDGHSVRVWSAGIPPLIFGFGVAYVLDGIILAVVLPIATLSLYLVAVRTMGGFSSEDRATAERLDNSIGVTVFQRIVPSDTKLQE